MECQGCHRFGSLKTLARGLEKKWGIQMKWDKGDIERQMIICVCGEMNGNYLWDRLFHICRNPVSA